MNNLAECECNSRASILRQMRRVVAGVTDTYTYIFIILFTELKKKFTLAVFSFLAALCYVIFSYSQMMHGFTLFVILKGFISLFHSCHY